MQQKVIDRAKQSYINIFIVRRELKPTAMGPRHIEQSCDEPPAGGFPNLFNSRNLL